MGGFINMLIFASKLGIISIWVAYIVGGWVQKGKEYAYIIKEWPLRQKKILYLSLANTANDPEKERKIV